MTPLLLVSVRSVSEAKSALEGGAHVIDVKEPARGSLGMADPSVIDQIVTTVAHRSGSTTATSAALGDLADWMGRRSLAILPSRLQYAKLGFAGSVGDTGWPRAWREVREGFESATGRPLQWIAVAYADWEQARAPHPLAVIEAAREADCAGVLFDTFAKDGLSLLDCLSADQLVEYSAAVRNLGMTLALAGSVAKELLPKLVPFAPDIVGIRTAACHDGDRNGLVSARAVAEFRGALQAVAEDCDSQSVDLSAPGGGKERMRL